MGLAEKLLKITVALSLALPLVLGLSALHSGLCLTGAAMAAQAADQSEEEAEPFGGTRETVADPLEKFNRAMFNVNDKLYFWGIKPASTVYSAYFPTGVRVCFRNAYTNALMPVRFINNVLQGKFEGGGEELARFAINSTMGAGGLFDVATTHFHIAAHDEDFGQTLGYWGVGQGVYIVWPVFGPSSTRDGVGMIGDAVADPLFYAPIDWYVSAGIKAGKMLNSASLRIGEYEDFKKASLDPYVSMRDAYLQHRAEDVRQ